MSELQSDLPADFIPLKNLQSQPDPWIWLFSMTSPTDDAIIDLDGQPRVLGATANPVPLEWGTEADGSPRVWSPWDVAFGELPQNSEGSVDGLQLGVSNVLGLVGEYAATNDGFADHILRMILVHPAALANPAAALTTKMRVTDISSIDENAVVLNLSLHVFQDVSIPDSLFSRQCRHRYRGEGCDFIGDPGNVELGQCVKTLAACKQRGAWELVNGLTVLHPLRFGGQAALPAGPFRVF